MERYDEHEQQLASLSVGDSIQVQNREGNHPLRWDKTRQIVERLEYGQYLVKYDVSGRVLLRTRGHLRKIKPCTWGYGWPELVGEEMESLERQNKQQDLATILIPGAVGTIRVLHQRADGGDELQELQLGKQLPDLPAH